MPDTVHVCSLIWLSLESKLMPSMTNSFSRFSDMLPLIVHSRTFPKIKLIGLELDQHTLLTISNLEPQLSISKLPIPTLIVCNPSNITGNNSWEISGITLYMAHDEIFLGPKDLQSLTCNTSYFSSNSILIPVTVYVGRSFSLTETEGKKMNGK